VSQINRYGYGWNGYGFRAEGSSGIRRGQITQLGYPGGLDNGLLMQRNDSQAQYLGTGKGSSPLNLVFGSRMNGGSSGGPQLVNFGTRPAATGAPGGASANENFVPQAGVTTTAASKYKVLLPLLRIPSSPMQVILLMGLTMVRATSAP
jgi:hypothetical protein